MALAKEWYYLLHPKVVHLVTTVDGKGRINAAPMSWVTPISDDPPLILVAAWYESDTYRNVEETGELVLNVAPKGLKDKVLVCAEDFPRGVNELEKAGLTWSPSKAVKPPRVNGCVAWIECKAKVLVKKEAYSFIIAEAKAVEVKEGCYENFLPKVEVLLHAGGEAYSALRVV